MKMMVINLVVAVRKALQLEQKESLPSLYLFVSLTLASGVVYLCLRSRADATCGEPRGT